MLYATRVDFSPQDSLVSTINSCLTTRTSTPVRVLSRQCFYINMDNAKTRRAHFEEWANVNGLTPERYVPQKAIPGAVSLTHAHVDIWRTISQKPDGWYAIFEDDVSTHAEVEPLWDVASEWIRKSLPHDVAYLGLCRTEFEAKERISGKCSHAYILTPSGAARMLRAFETYSGDSIIDEFLEQYVHALVFEPTLESSILGHIGGVFQDRTAPWYTGTTISYI